MAESALRIASLCLALAGAEMLHGIARSLLLSRLVGAARAKRWSIVSGSALAFGICWLLVPGIGIATTTGAIGVGVVASGWMAAFDVAIGRAVMKQPWPSVLRDFDLRRGGLLPIGLAVLAAAPLVVLRLRG